MSDEHREDRPDEEERKWIGEQRHASEEEIQSLEREQQEDDDE